MRLELFPPLAPRFLVGHQLQSAVEQLPGRRGYGSSQQVVTFALPYPRPFLAFSAVLVVNCESPRKPRCTAAVLSAPEPLLW